MSGRKRFSSNYKESLELQREFANAITGNIPKLYMPVSRLS